MTAKKKMSATILYLRNAAQITREAADRLDCQDSWHLEHARSQIDLALADLALCKRQIDREQRARAGAES